jgi:cyanophycin synthetase
MALDRCAELLEALGVSAGEVLHDEYSECLLRDQGWTLESVPPAGARVHLKSAANRAAGGSLRDVTDSNPPRERGDVRARRRALRRGRRRRRLPDERHHAQLPRGRRRAVQVNVLPSLEVHLFAEGRADRDVLGDMLDRCIRTGRGTYRLSAPAARIPTPSAAPSWPR